MQFTLQDEPDLTIPDETWARARLQEIKYRTFEWTDRKTNETKTGETLEWWWEISQCDAGDQFVGRMVRSECNPQLNNRPDNRFRIWAEALLQREIPVGMALDSDDLTGLEAKLLITQEPDKKDRLKKWNRVSEVIPVGDSGYPADPPF